MEQNPFAPPSAAADQPTGKGMVFSPEGVRVVASLATWMRGLSIFYFLFVALIALGSCVAFASGGGRAMGAILVLVIVGIGLAAAANWLRSAASDFERGVMADDEFGLGQGFRSLRAYLILFGVVGILSLCWQIYQASEVL